MQVAQRYYDCSPRIVRSRQQSTITIRPLFGHCEFRDTDALEVALVPTCGVLGQTGWVEYPRAPAEVRGGSISVSLAFEQEQEYVLLLERVRDGQRALVAEFRLYAVDDDLFARRPLKGDLHLHTHYSDGRESPAFVAASCRKIGLDFMAITDHRQYAPSLEAIAAFADVETDLLICPGEEVHPPNNPVHIVNFGASKSINALFNTDGYRNEVAEVARELTLPQGVDRYSLASCIWCFRNIREAGGLGVFCHPYWLTGYRFDVPEYLTDAVFDSAPYDALELIGGYHLNEAESNMLQVARYQEERARGKRIPVVGSSDSHGCEQADLFGWYYTIVFAKANERAEIIGSIKDLYSVAVEALPGEHARAFGPFRLVRYAQFLMREVFPLHDELCFEEGGQMIAYAGGDASAADVVRCLNGRTAKLYDRIWGSL